MNRRELLKKGVLAAAGLMVAGTTLTAAFGATPQTIALEAFARAPGNEDCFVVIVRLGGGNDGVGMIVPFDQYGNLLNHRPGLLYPMGSYLSISGVADNKLHPVMTGLRDCINNGLACIVNSVGIPALNRSHFVSECRYTTGIMDFNDPKYKTGIIGAALDDGTVDTDSEYPSVITIGSTPSTTCQGETFNHSFVKKIGSSGTTDQDLGTYDNDNSMSSLHEEHVQDIAGQLNTHGVVIENAIAGGQTLSSKYDNSSQLSQAFQLISKMKTGVNPIGTKIFCISLGGFDTHSNQIVRHENLLSQLSDGIAGFMDDAEQLGFKDRLLGTTYSEFGRQIQENGSIGTDHGDGCPQIMFGGCLQSKVIGLNPIIPSVLAYSSQGVDVIHDIRDIWTTLIYWLSGEDPGVIAELFEDDYVPYVLPVMGGCSGLSVFEQTTLKSGIKIFPNPCISYAKVEGEFFPAGAVIRVYNELGAVVMTREIYTDTVDPIILDTSSLARSSYNVVLCLPSGQKIATRLIRA